MTRHRPENRVVSVDVETTGFGSHDRIVEIAAVEIDLSNGQVVDEYDTLVNPMRDIGPTEIHGITPSMVEAAPTFGEIAGSLARRLHGSVLVAHNLAFDTRFLTQEMNRIKTRFDTGSGVCTYQATKQKLMPACQSHGIETGDHHRALSDARAAGMLAARLGQSAFRNAGGCSVGYIDLPVSTRTQRRQHGTEHNPMQRAVSLAHFPFSDEALLQYGDLLDWVLDDHVVTASERRELADAARELGISSEKVRHAHQKYFEEIAAAVRRDGVVTQSERDLLLRTAAALGIHESSVPAADRPPTVVLAPGMRVCFTGAAVVDAKPVDRAQLERAAAAYGLVAVPSVTQKGCDVLVAADASSGSGKAAKARRYGKPVISVEDFLSRIS